MIFDLKNNEPTITIEGIFIPEFRNIWESDKSKEKLKASQMLSYIYHVADFASSYSKLAEGDRLAQCKEDYLKVKINDVEWDMIAAAISKYKKLQDTHSMRLLAGARYAVDKFTEQFYSIDFNERDDKGRPVHNSKDLSSNLEKIGKIVTSLNDLEDVVNKERAANSKIARGAKPSSVLNQYVRPYYCDNN